MNDARALSCRLAHLLGREHHDLAEFLLGLADFDRERQWLKLGYTSCFYYLHRELGLSKGADSEAVLEAALDLLLAAKAKQKGLVEKPRPAPQRTSERPATSRPR